MDEAGFEDLENWGLLVKSLQLLGNLEVGSGSFLSQNSDRKKVVGGDGDGLVRGGLNVSAVNASFEFDSFGLTRQYAEYEV